MKKRVISHIMAAICCMTLSIALPSSAIAQTDKKGIEDIKIGTSNLTDLTLKLISSHSWKSLDITCIELNYSNHTENIIVEASNNGEITLDEYNSINNKKYAANVTLSGSKLTITQSTQKPIGGYDSEARLYIPSNYSGLILVNNKGNIRISNMNGSASYDINNNEGVVSFMSTNASNIKVNSTFPGELTMRDVTSVLDTLVIGRTVINGNSIISGVIRGNDGVRSSDVVLNLKSINGNLNVENERGSVCIGFPTDASFKLNATAYSVANKYPNGSFQTTFNSIKGSSGNNPIYNINSNSNIFLLDIAR